jgi:hypothetical protein
VVGATLKPGLFCPAAFTFRGTNPACFSRFSTLHRAHAPVGGQSDFLVDGVELAVDAVAAASSMAARVSGAFAGSRDEPHPSIATTEMARVRVLDRVMAGIG